METVVQSRMNSKVQSALTSLCKLYCVHGIVENLGGFIQVCYLYEKFNMKNIFFFSHENNLQQYEPEIFVVANQSWHIYRYVMIKLTEETGIYIL